MNEHEKYLNEARKVHANSLAWPGESLKPHLPELNRLIERLKVKSILDYGCGKARFHPKEWSGLEVAKYDPAVPEFSTPPPAGKTFDLVICTDVLEHIPMQDVDSFIARVAFKRGATGFMFFSVCCRPAHRILPNGDNAHATIQPPAWWRKKFEGYNRLTVRFNGTGYWDDINRR